LRRRTRCITSANPLDFYLWVHLKTVVHEALVDKEEELHHRTVDAWQTIRNYPGIFELMMRSMMKRVEDILSTYYKCTHSFIIHKLNISRHMLMSFITCTPRQT
jgi:hypothetical protein